MCLIPMCPPEGGHYKTGPILSSNTDSESRPSKVFDIFKQLQLQVGTHPSNCHLLCRLNDTLLTFSTYPSAVPMRASVFEQAERNERRKPEIVGAFLTGKSSEKVETMKILLYSPDNGVTRNFMPHLWMFLLQAYSPGPRSSFDRRQRSAHG